MSDVTALLGLCAQTAVHAGAGTSVGAIDLPIQREAHTYWPCVFGSAVKGACRAAARHRGLGTSDEHALFGPEVTAGTGSEHAGALSIGDAKLLLLPLPTLDQAYRWVACPSLLDRYRRDAQRMGIACKDLPSLKVGDDSTALGHTATNLYLLEYRLQCRVDAGLSAWAKHLALLAGREESEVVSRLTVVSDALFNHLSRHGTPVAAHVRLNPQTKTVEQGALWYEETLPAESVMYVPLLVQRSRIARYAKSASELFETFQRVLGDPGWLQVGGNETVGMGWCAVHVVRP